MDVNNTWHQIQLYLELPLNVNKASPTILEEGLNIKEEK